ncbi:MAG: type III pantothenate kinase [Sphaerochaetaceae bacterium]|nr:type III pantothenate kinase [Sphaerochaetaceae bacterium]
MLLVVDIGNTNVVMALHDTVSWVAVWRIHSDQKKTSDEYFVIIDSMLRQTGVDPHSIDQSIISSVVPNLTRSFEKVVKAVSETHPVMVNHDCCVGLVRESIPSELGYDLLSNAVAAHYRYPDDTVMVIDFGTALTFTTVDDKGNILGVSIAPGLITAVNSLFNNTAQIPQVQLKIPKSTLGTNSDESIRSGIMFGFSGLVNSMIRRTSDELHRTLKVIITGGLSQTIAPLIDHVDDIEPLHTLEGLRIINEGLTRNPS